MFSGLFSKSYREVGNNGLGAVSETAQLRPAPPRNTENLLETYNTNPWIYAACTRVGQEVGSTPWRLFDIAGMKVHAEDKDLAFKALLKTSKPSNTRFEKAVRGRMDDERLVEIEQDPFLDLLEQPNPVMDGVFFFWLTQLYLDLTGNCFWVIERDEKRGIKELYPIPPHWILKVPTPKEPTYEVRFRLWQGKIPESEIIWMKNPNPVQPFEFGTGTVSALAQEVDTDEGAATFMAQRFENSAMPELLIGVEGAREEQLKAAKRNWIREHMGARKAFMTHWHSGRLQVERLTPNFQELQLVELRKFERNTIIQVFGVPPEILGILENSNRSTIDAADFLFTKRVIRPRLDRIWATLQKEVLPQFVGGHRRLVLYDSPVPEDKEHIVKVMSTAPKAFKVNEWRAAANLPPLPGSEGEELYDPSSGMAEQNAFGRDEGGRPSESDDSED